MIAESDGALKITSGGAEKENKNEIPRVQSGSVK